MLEMGENHSQCSPHCPFFINEKSIYIHDSVQNMVITRNQQVKGSLQSTKLVQLQIHKETKISPEDIDLVNISKESSSANTLSQVGVCRLETPNLPSE